MQDDEPREDVIQEIRKLQERAKSVELAEFFQLLADDWDERHDSE
jgi:hypothetical protein